jgi:hypothetical protein
MALLGELNLNGVGWGCILREIAWIPAGAHPYERQATKKKHGQLAANRPCPFREFPPLESPENQIVPQHQGFFST